MTQKRKRKLTEIGIHDEKNSIGRVPEWHDVGGLPYFVKPKKRRNYGKDKIQVY